jgi:hypothetical protein
VEEIVRTALCLGGGATLWGDLDAIKSSGLKYHGVIACNESGTEYNGQLDAWVTLHPRKFAEWRRKRERNGHDPALKSFAHAQQCDISDLIVTPYRFPGMRGSASSGIFTAKVALVDLKYDRAILCGIPMLGIPHFFDKKAWRSHGHFRNEVLHIPEKYAQQIRSMSGWTRLLFGSPQDKDPK